MSDPAPSSVIRRKLSPTPAAPLGEAEDAALWREVLPKAAEAQQDLPLSVISVRARRTDPATFAAAIRDNDLILSLTGTGGGAGLAVLDPVALRALTEILTLGDITTSDVPERAATATDAALAADALNGWLASLGDEAGEAQPALFSMSAGAHLPGSRAARLSLKDVPLEVLTVELDFGGGLRAGVVTFATPPGRSAAVRHHASPACLSAPVTLQAELTRFDLPYGRVRAMAVGDVIDLPTSALASVRLHGADGQTAGRGRLGQSGGRRAIRLGAASPPELTRVETVATPAVDLPDIDLPEIPAAPLDDMTPLDPLPEEAALPDLPDIGDLPPIDGLPDLEAP